MTQGLCNCPRFTIWRSQLLKSCEDFINQIINSELTDSVDVLPTETFQQENQTYTSAYSSPSQTKITNLMEYFHGRMIQEWYFFLKQIFGEAILFHLKNRNLSRFPSITIRKINLRELKPTSKVTELRKSLCFMFKESFSFEPYDQRINLIKKFFITNDIEQNVKREVKKHVLFRNSFEHHNGIIRDDDLRKIGRSGQRIEIMNDQGDMISVGEGEPIKLYKPEIEQLYKAIKEYSTGLQLLKELA